MWRVALLVLALCCVTASGKSIFDDDYDDPKTKKPATSAPAPKKTDQPPPEVRTPPPEHSPAPAQPAAPVQPAPAPAQPVAPVTPPLPMKVAMVSDAALAQACKMVTEAYEEKFAAARTTDKKSALARTLFDAALTEKDVNARCALLVMSRDLAGAAGDYAAAADAINEIDNAYVVDGLKMSADALAAAAKTAHAGEQRKKLMYATTQLIDKALGVDRYDVAKVAADVGATVCKASADGDLLKIATDNAKRVMTAEVNYANVKLAIAILKQKPADPTANFIVGKYLCAIKGDWAAGLPMLAKSGDPTLSTLAQKEANAPDLATQLMLADGWWDVSKEQGLESKQFQARAVLWYTQVAPALTGLEKLKAEQRVNSVAAIQAIIKDPGSKEPVAAPAPDGQRPPEIQRAIAAHALVEGMTFHEACRSARLPFKLVFRKDSQVVYRWTIKGRTGTHQVAHPGLRGGAMYETITDFGIVAYVEATFVNDSLTEFKRISP